MWRDDQPATRWRWPVLNTHAHWFLAREGIGHEKPPGPDVTFCGISRTATPVPRVEAVDAQLQVRCLFAGN